MKKLLLAGLIYGLTGTGYAQTPEKKPIALITKSTATWCGPCGTWGWAFANTLINGTQGKALYIGAYVGQTDMDNDKFKNPTADTFYRHFLTPEYGGIPDFAVNGIGQSSLMSSIAEDNCFNAINAFNTTVPAASPANEMTINGSTVTATAKAQFWAAGSGEYYLAAYLIEDEALNLQNGQIGVVKHHNVLRGSMSPGKPWGELLVNGAVTENQVFDKTFTFEVTDNTWEQANFRVYTVIWKKNGNEYEFVNAARNGGSGTPVQDISGVQEVSIFPNPASGSATLLVKASEAQVFSIRITDVTGRNVYQKEHNKLVTGSNSFTLPLAGLNAGVYTVTLSTGKGSSSQRIAVVP